MSAQIPGWGRRVGEPRGVGSVQGVRGTPSGSAAALLLCFPGLFSRAWDAELPWVPSVDRVVGEVLDAGDSGTTEFALR